MRVTVDPSPGGGTCTSAGVCVSAVPVLRSGIAVDVSASPGAVTAASSPITFTYVVTNTGNEPLQGVTVSDNRVTVPQAHTGDTDGVGLLDVDETWTYTATQTLTTSQTNTATARGTGATTSVATTGTDTVTVATSRPELNVSKAIAVAPSGPAAEGLGRVSYTVTVKNNGTLATTFGPLTDTPKLASALTVVSASWTGQTSGSADGPGPYSIDTGNTPIGPGASQAWTLTLTYRWKSSGQGALACATGWQSGAADASNNVATLPVTQKEVDDGVVESVARVTGRSPIGGFYSFTYTHRTIVTPTGGIDLDKSVESTTPAVISQAGETITNLMVARNAAPPRCTA